MSSPLYVENCLTTSLPHISFNLSTNNVKTNVNTCILKIINVSSIQQYLFLLHLWFYNSIIKPYNSFFVINSHIARQDFILNDLFSSGGNPGKILTFTSPMFSTSVAMTSHKHKQKVAQKFTNASRMQI